MDKLKLSQEGRTAHQTLPACVWRCPETAFANLEEFSLFVPLIHIYECKLVSMPSTVWELFALGERSEATQQPSPPAQYQLECID